MSTSPMVLPVYPWPMSDERLELVKQAKAALELPYKIMPAPAVPGSPGRVLCFGRPAPFYTESVVVGADNVDKLDSVKAALEFTLEAPAGTSGSFTEQMWLSAVMGCEVTLEYELSKHDLEDERIEKEIARAAHG